MSVIAAACKPVGIDSRGLSPEARDLPIFSGCFHEVRRKLWGRDMCTDEAWISVAFFARGGHSKQVPTTLPRIVPNECRVVLVDEAGATPKKSNGWRVVKVHPCFPREAERSAHFIKTVLPLLLPQTRRIFYGDAKCQRRNGSYPIEELRTALGQDGSVDVVAVKHELGASKTVADEFNATVRIMRQRHMPQAVFEDISVHRQWLASQPNYRMDQTSTVNDAFCLAWARTPAARVFSCQWSLEVALLSMREQLSFDHARPANLRVAWLAKRFTSHPAGDIKEFDELEAAALAPVGV